MKKSTLTLLAAFAVAGTSLAGTSVVSTKEYKQPVITPCFRDTEFAFDLFYSFNDAEHKGHTTSYDRSSRIIRDFDAENGIITTDSYGFAVEERTPQYFRDGSGGGAAFDWFFYRYFGISVEGNWWLGVNSGFDDRVVLVHDHTVEEIDPSITNNKDIKRLRRSSNKHDVAHQLTGSLILRYPFEGSFCWAPYIFGGGGGIWDGSSTGFGHVGLGWEWRMTPNFGVFSDWRWEFTGGHRNDVNVSRTGIRMVF
jgi:hypothetical protein